MNDRQSFLFTFSYDKDAPGIMEAFGLTAKKTADMLAAVVQEVHTEANQGRNPVDIPEIVMGMLSDHKITGDFLVAAGVMQIKEWQKEARMGVIDMGRMG